MTFLRNVAIGACIALCAGCVNLGIDNQVKAEARRTTFAPVAKVKKAADAPRFDSVKIRAFRMLPPFESRNFVRMRPDGQCITDYYASWIDNPAGLFEIQFENGLRDSGLFEAVLDSRSMARARWTVEAVVTDCYIDERGAKPLAVTGMRITLEDGKAMRTGRPKVLVASATAEVGAHSAAGFAKAFNEALKETFENLIGKIAATLPKKEE